MKIYKLKEKLIIDRILNIFIKYFIYLLLILFKFYGLNYLLKNESIKLIL